MKSVLYVGASLMIGAGIYGVIDYSKTSQQKAFKNLYADPAPVATDIQSRDLPTLRQSAPEKKAIQFAHAVQTGTEPIPAVEISANDAITEHTDEPPVSKKSTAAKKTEIEISSKKELDLRLFSRAAPPRPVKKLIVNEDEELPVIDTAAN